MHYEKLLKNLTPKLLTNTSRYRGLMVNEKTGAIFPASKWGFDQAKKEKIPYNEHSVGFYFMPGNICVINTVPLAIYDLVPYGMPGKFIARQSFKSEYTYIHELFDKYESFPGMKVSMLNGKPIDARLLVDITPNPKALQQFEERLTEIKRVFFVLNRMKDKVPEFSNHRPNKTYEQITQERRELLTRILSSSTTKFPNWAERLMPFYSFFWHNARVYRSQDKGPPDHNQVFDNMIRFDKAALFRNLKVIT